MSQAGMVRDDRVARGGVWRDRIRFGAGLLRTAVGAFFILVAIAKLTSAADAKSLQLHGLNAFARAIADQGVIDPAWSRAAAVGAVLAEAGVGMLLLSHVRPRAGAAIGIALLVVFSGYLLLAYARNPRMPCGCMGRLTTSTIREALVRNAALILALLGSLAGSVARRPSSPWGRGTRVESGSGTPHSATSASA